GVGQLRARCHLMERNPVLPERVDDLDLASVPADDPDVAGLTAAPGVEDRPIEDDPVLGDRQDAPFAHGEIRVLGRELFDGSAHLGVSSLTRKAGPCPGTTISAISSTRARLRCRASGSVARRSSGGEFALVHRWVKTVTPSSVSTIVVMSCGV